PSSSVRALRVSRRRPRRGTAVPSPRRRGPSGSITRPRAPGPDGDGYTLIRRLREGGNLLPAVALTGHARPQDRETALEAGVDEHLAKPIEPAELVRMVAELARQH